MASRVLHLAVAEIIINEILIKDKNRFRLGSMLPDAYNQDSSKTHSHLQIFVCGNSKKTYDLERFLKLYKEEMVSDELYLGYYLHLIQDMIFRELVYEKYKWNPLIEGNVQRLHNDYNLINKYVISKYNLTCNIYMLQGVEKKPLFNLYQFNLEQLLIDLKNDFKETCNGKIFFFSREMAEEFIQRAADACIKEIKAMSNGKHYVDAYQYAWKNKGVSLLKTTQNTRDLGGYKTNTGNMTRVNSLLRSDIQNYPSEEDLKFLQERNITTIIDMRGQKDVDRKPSGFANTKGFDYYNCQINQCSGLSESMEAVPISYLIVAKEKAMPDVFRCIAKSTGGIMFNCTAGKDRTGVVAAILLYHAGVSDKDIIENYVLTREYGKGRLELVHKNFPEVDMNIVTPNEKFMEEFLKLFREEFGNTDDYFKIIGLNEEEIEQIKRKLIK